MWLSAPRLTQPTRPAAAFSAGSRRSRRARAAWPPRATCPSRAMSRAPPSQPDRAGPISGSRTASIATPSSSTPLRTGPADLATIDAWFDAQRQDAGIPGAAIVVVRDGVVVHTAGFGTADATGRPITPETPFVLGSVSKSMTAFAVAQL